MNLLFDLGGTLVEYFGRSEIDQVFAEAIGEVEACLRRQGRAGPAGDFWTRALAEKHEAADGCVRPLEGRLARIFQLDPATCGELLVVLCRAFLRPILGRGRRYNDTLPVLEQLRAEGHRLAIVSNTLWGSPAGPWREEIARQGLAGLIDLVVFCRDAGWRKPAPAIFTYALDRLGLEPEACLFVGDDPRWDLAGPQAIGMPALLIDRLGTAPTGVERVRDLYELRDRLPAILAP